jgi:hypothetical protein
LGGNEEKFLKTTKLEEKKKKEKKKPAKTPIHPFVLCLHGKCFFNVFCVSLMFFWSHSTSLA